MATLFRGYEVILSGRDPRDAIYITSRACGVCGGVHAVTSALAIEMAFGCVPPPLGVVVRNLALALEFLYDHPLHLPCWPAPTTPRRWSGRPTRSWSPGPRRPRRPTPTIHGYRTINDIMDDLNPLTGKLYLEALEMTRVAREAYVLICGKYPHPQTIVPGRHELDDHAHRHERVVRPAGQVLRLLEEAGRDLGRPHRLLLRGQPRLRAGGRPPHEPDPHRHLGPPRGLRRHLRRRRPRGASGAGPRPA